MGDHYLNVMGRVTEDIRQMVVAGHQKYGDSCLQRGRNGLYMMFARKWDRIEHAMKQSDYNFDDALRDNPEPDGLLDDIQDLVVYLCILWGDLEVNPIDRRRATQRKMPLPRDQPAAYKDPEIMEVKTDGMEHPHGYDAQEELGAEKP